MGNSTLALKPYKELRAKVLCLKGTQTRTEKFKIEIYTSLRRRIFIHYDIKVNYRHSIVLNASLLLSFTDRSTSLKSEKQEFHYLDGIILNTVTKKTLTVCHCRLSCVTSKAREVTICKFQNV